MRSVILIIALSTLSIGFSCRSYTNNSKNTEKLKKTTTLCPEDGNCSFKSSPKTSVVFKTDELGIGYVDFLEKEASLLTFEYQRTEVQHTLDGHYMERVYIELPPAPRAISLTNSELQEVNLLFERRCYCKGETGVYPINRGTLKLTPLEDDRFHLELWFTTSEVPHIISKIEETFSLKKP
ncbi:hypothetical protein ES711_06615 [Gelidibacter salicanalis]|uniref:Lipoprotein n=1 Tax=Gelidibacter salicanalis TaxID=291193 RepID=A0A5C7AQP6_9FLAO|nr:hypothetical protein [Gelidibacter salicanalis]TXE08182.1 hypothetical protein ES711_06615 [Gelidibacter salicanalis]